MQNMTSLFFNERKAPSCFLSRMSPFEILHNALQIIRL